jgi:predicted RNA-binding Zn ribbon-like protein
MEITQLPGEAPTKPAPGELVLVQQFVNSIELDEEGSDTIADPAGLRAWLAQAGLLEARADLTDDDVTRAQRVREALRALLLANNDGQLEPAAIPTLNDAAQRAGLLVRFRDDGDSELAPEASGADGALGRLLGIVYTAMAEGTWPRLKACREDTCQWAFYDRSKNRSGAWCTMEVCGNRNKARAYRERRRPAEG